MSDNKTASDAIASILNPNGIAGVNENLNAIAALLKQNGSLSKDDVNAEVNKAVDKVVDTLDAVDGKKDGVVRRESLVNIFDKTISTAPASVKELAHEELTAVRRMLSELPETFQAAEVKEVVAKPALRMAESSFDMLDANRDGSLSKQEVAVGLPRLAEIGKLMIGGDKVPNHGAPLDTPSVILPTGHMIYK